MLEQYKALGVSDAVLTFGEGVLADLKDRFAGIDAIAEANQMKVIAAMQKNRLAANHFNLSSGYGYDDEGRDNAGASLCRLLPRRGGPGAPPDHLRHPRAGAGPGRPICCPGTSC